MKRPDERQPLVSSWPWLRLPETRLHLPDVLMFAAGLALFYGVLAVARTWLGPLTPEVEISRSPWALPAYAGYSLLRIGAAYTLSLAFTLVYGYVAAYNARAERYMIPLLDVLQSIPVLSFLPGVMLAMVALFPERQLGVEFGSILLIFTGQVWNMAFSFYSSLKSVPREMREAAKIYRFSWWQKFTQVELPFAAIGLVWNSMMSVAGGWFFLMACEMFVLGKRDFRLPGLGSYLQTAASAGDTSAILWGIAAMVAVIVLLDQFVWRPVIAWAEKFKVEQVESTDVPSSWLLEVLRESRAVAQITEKAFRPMRERLLAHFARLHDTAHGAGRLRPWKTWSGRMFGVVAVALVLYGSLRAVVTADRTKPPGARAVASRSWCNVSAGECGAPAGHPLDCSGGRRHRFPSQTRSGSPAPGANRCLGASDRALSSRSALPGPHWWRVRGRFDRPAVARNAVVHPIQRDCGSNGYSHRSEGGHRRLSHYGAGPLAKTHPAGNFSLLGHGSGYRIRRSVEREHYRRVFSLGGTDDLDRRTRFHHQPGYRQRQS